MSAAWDRSVARRAMRTAARWLAAAGLLWAAQHAPRDGLVARAADADEKIRDLTFDDIKFDAEKGEAFERSQITSEIEALDGKRVRIRGWILPQSVFKQRGIKNFVLVRDNQECCFGPMAALYDCIVVRMNRGKSCDFSTQAVAVEGVFAIDILENPIDPTARPQAVYRLDADLAE
jgi:hypothetical protein